MIYNYTSSLALAYVETEEVGILTRRPVVTA